ncbi:hypothetical protein A2U01_0067990, partial [Trifolium medium]|nr:hypothetical protein [Trifolium medium]
TDVGEKKTEASANQSTSDGERLEELQQPVQEVTLQKNQETVWEGNVQQPLKMKMSDDRLKFGGVTVDSQSPETPASIVLSPKALDRKLGSNGKEIQASCCSVTVSP